jgi:hypothetical protein
MNITFLKKAVLALALVSTAAYGVHYKYVEYKVVYNSSLALRIDQERKDEVKDLISAIDLKYKPERDSLEADRLKLKSEVDLIMEIANKEEAPYKAMLSTIDDKQRVAHHNGLLDSTANSSREYLRLQSDKEDIEAKITSIGREAVTKSGIIFDAMSVNLRKQMDVTSKSSKDINDAKVLASSHAEEKFSKLKK